ncbi:MAG: serine/threonine protein kinase [Bdellovibrionota bacterium]
MEYAFSPLGSPETKFFFELTPDRILDAVERFGVRCTGRCLTLNSMENRVYEVEIELPPDVKPKKPSERFRIIKFYRPGRWTKEQILEEHQFLLDLVEYEIPVIAPLKDDSGQTLLQVPDLPIYFAVFPKQGGRNPGELDDMQALQVGRLLGRMHNVGAARQAPNRIRITPENIAFQSLDFLLDSDVLPNDIAHQYEDLVEQIVETTSPWFEGVPYHRIHGDCHFGNLLWSDEGPYWVDFDDMATGPAVQDVWLLLPGRDDFAYQKLQLLLEGYEQMRSFDRSSIRLIEPLRAMRMIYFTAWIAKRWEDPAFKKTFVEFGTPKYWRDQLSQLLEQWELIQGGN